MLLACAYPFQKANTSPNQKEPGLIVEFPVIDFRWRGGHYFMGVHATFPESDAARFARKKVREVIHFTGTVSHLNVRFLGDGGSVELHLKDCKLSS
jgi:hypothetical protein